MIPRTAFIFHATAPSGANLWLARLLTKGGLPPDRCLALLPGASPLEEDLRAAGVPTQVIPVEERAFGEGNAWRLLRSKAGYLAALRRRLAQPDVEVVYVNSSVQVLPGIAARAAGKPVLWHVREAWGGGWRWQVKRRIILDVSHTMLFAGEAAREHFAPFPAAVRTRAVANGVSPQLAEWRAQRQELRRRHGWNDDELVVLVVGTVTVRKGVGEMLDAWPRIRERHRAARLVLAGAMGTLASDAPIRERLAHPPAGVELLGFRRDVAELMAAADLLALPSRAEAFPNVVVEAMMIGTPVVASPVADLPRLLAEGRGFLLPRLGAEEIAATVGEALAHPQEAQARARRAQQYAREHLTWDRQCAIIREELEGLRR